MKQPVKQEQYASFFLTSTVQHHFNQSLIASRVIEHTKFIDSRFSEVLLKFDIQVMTVLSIKHLVMAQLNASMEHAWLKIHLLEQIAL